MSVIDTELIARQRALVGRFELLAAEMEEEGVTEVQLFAAALAFLAKQVISRGRFEGRAERQVQIQAAMMMLHDTCQLGYHAIEMSDPVPKGTKIH